MIFISKSSSWKQKQLSKQGIFGQRCFQLADFAIRQAGQMYNICACRGNIPETLRSQIFNLWLRASGASDEICENQISVKNRFRRFSDFEKIAQPQNLILRSRELEGIPSTKVSVATLALLARFEIGRAMQGC